MVSLPEIRQVGVCVSWEMLVPVASTMLTKVIEKWCDLDDASLLAQSHMLRVTL